MHCLQVITAVEHIASLHKDLAKAHKQATAAMIEYAAELEQAGADKGALATFPALLGQAEQAAVPKKRSRVRRLPPPRRCRSSPARG